MDVAKFLAVQNFKPLSIPAYEKAGMHVTVRAVLEAEQKRLVQLAEEMKGATEDTVSTNLALMVAVFLGDENGARVFQDGDISSIKTNVPLVIQTQIVKEGLAYNLVTGEAVNAEKKT